MYKVIVFAGTTEGYALCKFLSDNRIAVWACVATEYGSRALEANDYLHVQAQRLTADEMTEVFHNVCPEFVLDATHPYAAEVTQNIKAACWRAQIPYHRVLREAGDTQYQAVYVESTEEAIEYLSQTEGNILLTTGSKELWKYTALPDYQERIYARVLSLASVMEACHSYGMEGRHLIGMQGPFSKEMNAAMLRQYDCAYLVTKDTGKAGGFQEKLSAAMECGVTPVIIGRPLQEAGMSVRECKKMLAEHFGITMKPKVTLAGIGMGGEDTLTVQGLRAIASADLLIGARRMVEAVVRPGQDVYCEYRSEAIAEYIADHPEYEHVVIVLSGDVGFYSGAKKLLKLLGEDAQVICGISSVVYFMAKIGLSWDDARLVSVHGRYCNLVSHIKYNKKVFAILGMKDGVAELAQKLVYYDMGDVLLYVGGNLSYENEVIFGKKASELINYEGDALSVVCAYHPEAEPIAATHGIPDEAFVRGHVPMTKEEVRTVSLSKLRLCEDSVCYDVGAGTGSVSIEMALRARQGMVYAIEKKEEAVELLKVNKRRFAADNLEIIPGTAPEALHTLPEPTHVFVGGTSGNMKEILDLVTRKNPNVRIVINCITLETVAEALCTIRKMHFAESEMVQLSVSRAKELGQYHMMIGENPIYVITCQYRPL